MKRNIISLIYTVITIFFLNSCTPSPHTTNPWQEEIKRIHIGMRRADVEKILPSYPNCPKIVFAQGSAQSITYWLDPQWKVRIMYDYTGIPRDKEGKALSQENPENKVLNLPNVTREDMPKVAINNISINGERTK